MQINELLKNIKSFHNIGHEIYLIHAKPQVLSLYETPFNLGLVYIGTILKQHEFKVKCVDTLANFFNLDLFLDEAARGSKKIFGFYTTADNIFMVYHIAELIKEKNPSHVIVLGGPQASALEGEVFKYSKDVDIVVKGEGEFIVLEIAQCVLREKGDISQINGIFYKDNEKIIAAKQAEPIANIDELPHPDRELIPTRGFHFFTFARGCPFKCTFCYEGVHGNRYRFHSPEYFCEEIFKTVEKYKLSFVQIVDDTLTANYQATEEICKRFINYFDNGGRHFAWFCEARANNFSNNEELLKLMVDAGLIVMQIGIESGDNNILKAYNKGITTEQIEGAVKNAYKVKLPAIGGNIIIGGPFETRSTIKKSIEFAKHLIELAPGCFGAVCGFLVPLPGTEIAKNPEKYKIKILDREFAKQYTMWEPLIELPELKKEEIRELWDEFKAETTKKMFEVLPKIPPWLIEKHYQMVINLSTSSQWYETVYQRCTGLDAYFKYKVKPRFKRLAEIPDDFIMDYYPLRPILGINYDKNNSIILPITNSTNEILTDNLEKEVYEYSCGKIPIKDLIRRIKPAFFPDVENEIIWKKHVKPIYEKLEQSFHIVFYK